MIIGLSGKMGVGKNEVADMLSYLLFINPNGTFKEFQKQQNIRNAYIVNEVYNEADNKLPNIHSFAANLKKCVAACTNIDFHNLESRSIKSSEIPWLGITYRTLLQRLGEIVRCQIKENFWVLSALSGYQNHETWLISDVRYRNEADEIRNKNGIVIRINRPNIETNDHISETDLDNYQNFRYVIENNGTLEDLFNICKNTIIPIIKEYNN